MGIWLGDGMEKHAITKSTIVRIPALPLPASDYTWTGYRANEECVLIIVLAAVSESEMSGLIDG